MIVIMIIQRWNQYKWQNNACISEHCYFVVGEKEKHCQFVVGGCNETKQKPTRTHCGPMFYSGIEIGKHFL